jgi:serine/threonine-protein kinase RsbT
METRVAKFWIQTEMDLARAVLQTANFCADCGFDRSCSQMVATAVSELARNIIKYAGCGEVILRSVKRGSTSGVEAVAEDQGPGIKNMVQALQDHFSSSGTLGLGLPGVKRMMDEFDIESEPDRGTRVTIRKWL